MTDLRTRIAAVIGRMNDCWCEDCQAKPVELDEFDLMVADAVIRELGWRQEFSVEYIPEGMPQMPQLYEWSCGHERVTKHRDEAEWDAKSFYGEEPDKRPKVVCRYVTDWTADE